MPRRESSTSVYPATGIPKQLKYTIYNVMAQFDLQCALDLHHIAACIAGCSYDRMKHKGIHFKLRDQTDSSIDKKVHVTIFANGKVLIMSASSIASTVETSNCVVKLLRSKNIGYRAARVAHFKVINVNASAKAQFGIRLEALATSHRRFSSFEPELCPGNIYRFCNPRATLVIYSNGKVICTGAKSEAQVATVFEKIYPVLLEHRVESRRLPAVI